MEVHPIQDLYSLLNQKRPLKKRIYYFLCRTWDGFLDATYWKLRNWNWKVPTPRGFDSRHGYCDTPELMAGAMFALFVRYYEGEYVKYQFKYTEADLENFEKNPEEYYEGLDSIKRNLVFQKRIEWVYNWIKTGYDHYDEVSYKLTFEEENKYFKDMHKAMHIIVKYHGWMWT